MSDYKPTYQTERFDIFRTTIVRNPRLGAERDVYQAWFRDDDVCHHLEHLSRSYHEGHSLRIKFVRLGGRKLDRSGIAAACKGVEDAVAYLLGADDGDPRWKPEWDQEVGGLVGVRVEIEVAR